MASAAAPLQRSDSTRVPSLAVPRQLKLAAPFDLLWASHPSCKREGVGQEGPQSA